MSWDVTLGNERTAEGWLIPVEVERHEEGGTYMIGGNDQAELNVTYNYGRVYRRITGGNLRDMLDGKVAGETIPLLERCVAELGTERSADYWEAADGNAGAALAILLGWARQHPDAVWWVN